MSGGHDDYQSEPIRGLPEKPPEGEHVLWQGAPSWWQLAKHVFHIRLVSLYFAVLTLWRASVRLDQLGEARAVVAAIGSVLPVAALGLGLFALLALLSSRTTVYTITNRRIVIRTGVALTVAINIPFKVVGAADLRLRSGGSGDIVLSLVDAGRVAYNSLWPSVRPWRLKNPEPMLRGIPDAERVAALLSSAVREALPGSVSVAVGNRPATVQTQIGMPASLGLSS